jgi:sugar transferase (PEP-CTERM/EpsH1 system associated)
MENGLVNLINGLPGDRYRHAIICLTVAGRFAKRIDPRKCSIHELHKDNGKDLRIYLKVLRLLRQLRPAAVHTRNLGTVDLAPVARLTGVPVCIHGEHGWDAADPQGQSVKYRYLRRVCDSFISEYVAVSEDIADWLSGLRKSNSKRITQIYNGVDTRRFCPEGPRAKLPFKDNADGQLIVGAIGRLDPIKNFDLLVAAIGKALEQKPALRRILRLVLVGDGEMATRLRRQVAEMGLESYIWFAGVRDDIDNLLRTMDIFVLPSRNEGISNTVLEAMATGLPIIASKVGGNPELIEDGQSGVLIAPNNVDALSNAIIDYIAETSIRIRHGEAARDRAETKFSLEAMVSSYAEMYDRLLTESRQARIN